MPPLHDLFLHVNAFARDTPWLNTPLADYAGYGLLLFVGLMALAWWRARTRGTDVMARAVLVPVAAVGAVAMQQLVDTLVAEPRPYAVYPDILVLAGRTTDPSFPSDHACIAGAVAAGLFLVDRRLGWSATIGALLMGFARVYSGVHWPLDVVAGLAFGAIVALTIMRVLQCPTVLLLHRLERGPLRPLLVTASASDPQVPLR